MRTFGDVQASGSKHGALRAHQLLRRAAPARPFCSVDAPPAFPRAARRPACAAQPGAKPTRALQQKHLRSPAPSATRASWHEPLCNNHTRTYVACQAGGLKVQAVHTKAHSWFAHAEPAARPHNSLPCRHSCVAMLMPSSQLAPPLLHPHTTPHPPPRRGSQTRPTAVLFCCAAVNQISTGSTGAEEQGSGTEGAAAAAGEQNKGAVQRRADGRAAQAARRRRRRRRRVRVAAARRPPVWWSQTPTRFRR